MSRAGISSATASNAWFACCRSRAARTRSPRLARPGSLTLRPRVAHMLARLSLAAPLLHPFSTPGYTTAYAPLLGPWRHRVAALLEVGIGSLNPRVSKTSMLGWAAGRRGGGAGTGYRPGASLRAWGASRGHRTCGGGAARMCSLR